MSETVSNAQRWSHALADFSAGKMHAAEQVAREILSKSPNDPDALLLLGRIAIAVGKPEHAVPVLRRVFATQANSVDGHLLAATAQAALNNSLAAETHLKAVLSIQPDHREATITLAQLLAMTNRPGDAEPLFRKLVKAEPLNFDHHNNLAVVLWRQKKSDEAIEHFEAASQIDPKSTLPFEQLAKLYDSTGDVERAIQMLRRALEIDPKNGVIWNGVGVGLISLGRDDEAYECFERAVEFAPDDIRHIGNLAQCARNLRKTDEAIANFERALTIDPNSHEFHMAYGMTLLEEGQFERGWVEFEHRLHVDLVRRSLSDTKTPQWDGAEMPGATIFLQPEQGMGDTICFARFAPLVAKRGLRVLMGAQNPVKELLGSLDGVAQVFGEREYVSGYQVQAALESLPYLLKLHDEKKLCPKMPYLTANAGRVAKFEPLVKSVDAKLRVGIVWAGNPNQPQNKVRSCKLQDFEKLAHPDIAFFSLQKGDAANQVATAPAELRLTDLSEQLQDMSDTAAAMQHLDLVISVCTSPAHLAGALARPVWLLLSFFHDWRWMHERTDSPWYPTMRVFRQPKIRDWDGVFELVRGELHKLV